MGYRKKKGWLFYLAAFGQVLNVLAGVCLMLQGSPVLRAIGIGILLLETVIYFALTHAVYEVDSPAERAATSEQQRPVLSGMGVSPSLDAAQASARPSRSAR